MRHVNICRRAAGVLRRETGMNEKLRIKIEQLRDLVWMEDISSPTVPEYVEHHESIQKILKFIDSKLLEEAETYD
jgi:hypothetical protein